jgi:hypothetical protein
MSSFGVKIFDNGLYQNFQQVEINTDLGRVVLSPDIVKEYGLNGKIFVSGKIKVGDTIKHVFLKQELKEKPRLYTYEQKGVKRFFLEKDSLNFIELEKGSNSGEKKSFREILEENSSGCKYAHESARLVRLTEFSLKNYLKLMHQCKGTPFPFIRYGFLIGLEAASISQNKDMSDVVLKTPQIKSDTHFLVGFFLDFPVLSNKISFHPELLYQRYNASSHLVTFNEIADAVIFSQSLNLPLLFRYTLPSKYFRPFIEAGPSINYIISDKSKLYSMPIKNNVIELDGMVITNSSPLGIIKGGYCFGGGLQLRTSFRNSIFLGIRKYHYGESDNTFSINKLQFYTGYNF